MPFRLAVQQSLLPGDTVGEQLARAAEYGFAGVELTHNEQFDVRRQVDVIDAARESTGVEIAAICTTNLQDPVVKDQEERNRRVTELVEMVDLASALGASGVISVPLRRSGGFEDAPLPELALDIYSRIVDYLGAGEARIFLEPLNRYEATFLTRVGQAAMLARILETPRIAALADLYHMNIEETAFDAPIEAAGSLLGHVHLADNTRDEPGTGMIDFAPAFRALRGIGYDGWLSLECRKLSDEPETALPASVAFLQGVWDAAGR